jgi:hypothetical protein
MNIKYELTNDNRFENNFFKEFAYFNTSIENFKQSKENALQEIKTKTNDIFNEIKNVEKELEKNENKIPELLKRLILSLVIATFFIAILRYVAKLYQNSHNEMLRAEMDDIAIRKIYVALKASILKDEDRKIVISNLMNENDYKDKIDDSESFNLTKEESGFLKEIISAILKKIS